MTKPTNAFAQKRFDALEAVLRAIEEAPAAEDDWDEIIAKARGLMAGYHARWANSGWNATAVGVTFHLPIINPATGRRSRTFTWAGRYGGLVERRGKRFLLVFKTVGEPIEEPDSPFWQRMAVDWQSSTYCLSQLQQDRPIDGILYDVLRRPAIRPRAIPKGSSGRSDRENVGTLMEIGRQGTYFGRPLDRPQRETALDGDHRETPDLYAIRVEADTRRRPDWYFQRRIVRRGRRQLAHDEAELWQTATEIRLARHGTSHWRNSASCHKHNRPCLFLPICSGNDTPRSSRWKPVTAIHPELGDALGDTDQRRVLTHSRMQCFKLCRRKHYYRYELAVAPVDRPPNRTLSLALVLHRALAVWWARQGKGNTATWRSPCSVRN